MFSPSLRYNPFNGIEWSFQMKDLGFNEFGEHTNANDEESRAMNKGGSGTSIEMTKVMEEDPEGDEEAEDAQIAI